MRLDTVDKVQIGDDLGSVEYVIRSEDVERFFSAMGEYRFGHHDETSAQMVPPLMIGNDYLKLYKRKYSTAGALHASLEMKMWRGVKVGETVVTSGIVQDKYHKRGRNSVVIVTTTHSAEAKPIVRFTITLTYL